MNFSRGRQWPGSNTLFIFFFVKKKKLEKKNKQTNNRQFLFFFDKNNYKNKKLELWPWINKLVLVFIGQKNISHSISPHSTSSQLFGKIHWWKTLAKWSIVWRNFLPKERQSTVPEKDLYCVTCAEDTNPWNFLMYYFVHCCRFIVWY